MPQLDPTYFPSQLLWLALTFFAVYLIMAKWGLPKVGEVLDERQNMIDSTLEKAAALQDEAEKMLQEHDAKINAARLEAALVLKKQNTLLTQEYTQKYKEIEESIAQKLSAAEASLQGQKEAFFKEVPELAHKVAADILKKLDSQSDDLNAAIKALSKDLKNV